MSKVIIVAHPETGEMFTEQKNDIFKCQVRSEEVVVKNKFITKETRVAFPPFTKDAVEAFSHLKDGDRFPIEGRIRKTVSSIPQFEGHQQVTNPETDEKMGYYHTFEFTSNLKVNDLDIRDMEPEDQAEILGLVKREKDDKKEEIDSEYNQG